LVLQVGDLGKREESAKMLAAQATQCA
jgi:hypothetical protein